MRWRSTLHRFYGNPTPPVKSVGTRSAADSESIERSTLSRVYSVCRRHANMWTSTRIKPQSVLCATGINVTGIHRRRSSLQRLLRSVHGRRAARLQLLKESRERGLLAPTCDSKTRRAVYRSWSAGANLACPTIRTTNDDRRSKRWFPDSLIPWPRQKCNNSLPATSPEARSRTASVDANCWWSRRN